MEAFLTHIHVDVSDLFAGFAGGILAALVTSGPRPNLWSIFCSIVVGALSGAYFGPIAPYWLPTSWGIKPSAGLSCGVGVAGMPISRLIILGVSRLKWSGLNGDRGSND